MTDPTSGRPTHGQPAPRQPAPDQPTPDQPTPEHPTPDQVSHRHPASDPPTSGQSAVTLPADDPAESPNRQCSDTRTQRRVLVVNGPNLGRLGAREPEVYGATTHAQLAALCIRAGTELDLDVDVRQSDSEAQLIGWLHEAADAQIPVVLNPAAYSHTSVALRDAAAMRTAALVEVHISNVHAREEFRHHSFISAVASGVIAGLGVQGYVLALSWIASELDSAATG